MHINEINAAFLTLLTMATAKLPKCIKEAN